MIIEDITLGIEHDLTELRLLAKALYKKLILVEEENSLLKGVLAAKEDIQQGKVLTSEEYKERFNLKGSANARSK